MKKTHSKHMDMGSLRRMVKQTKDYLSGRDNDAYAAVKRYLTRAGVNHTVAQRAYANLRGHPSQGMKSFDPVTVVDPMHVAEAARLMEATCDMAENLSEEEMLAVSLKRKELVSFVCYMRQLDTEYRFLKDLIEANGTEDLKRQANLGALGSDVERIKRNEFKRHGINPAKPPRMGR